MANNHHARGICMSTRKNRWTSALLAAALALSVAGPAAAQSGVDGYRSIGPEIEDEIQSGGPGPTPTAPDAESGDPVAQTSDDEADQLPFTGLDLGLMGAAGALLLGMGVGMHRITRTQDAA